MAANLQHETYCDYHGTRDPCNYWNRVMERRRLLGRCVWCGAECDGLCPKCRTEIEEWLGVGHGS